MGGVRRHSVGRHRRPGGRLPGRCGVGADPLGQGADLQPQRRDDRA